MLILMLTLILMIQLLNSVLIFKLHSTINKKFDDVIEQIKNVDMNANTTKIGNTDFIDKLFMAHRKNYEKRT